MMSFRPLVDDVVDEARSLANQLYRNKFPFEVSPVMPARTTQETYRLITAETKCRHGRSYSVGPPSTKPEELVCRLLNHGVRTVVVTKDRNVADRAAFIAAPRHPSVLKNNALSMTKLTWRKWFRAWEVRWWWTDDVD